MAIPEKIDRYEIKNELGRGGMATVYQAYDPRFERDVALKVLPREFLHEAEFRARFTREARTIAALEHPAIVPVYDFGESDSQPYLVMRLMSGGSLMDRLEKGPIPMAEATEILRRIGSALDQAHRKGIIHRDLKPSNILFDQYGEAYLADFGIVRLSASSNALTASGSLVGTPTYMSPEQVYGNKELDGRSDIYALGVILYQMLTGEIPYQADTPARMMMAHVMDPVPHILEKRPDLPADCDRIITKAMAKERDERFQTATDLTQALSTATQRSAPLDLPPLPVEQETAVPPTPTSTPQPQPKPTPSPPLGKPSAFDEPALAEELIATTSDNSGGSGVPIWIWGLIGLFVFVCMGTIIGVAALAAARQGDETPTAVAIVNEPPAESDTAVTPPPTTANTVAPTAEEEGSSRGSLFETLDDALTDLETAQPNLGLGDAEATRASILATRAAASENNTNGPAGGLGANLLATRQSMLATRTAAQESDSSTDAIAYINRIGGSLAPIYGPEDGAMPHDNDNRIENVYADVTPQDFVLQAIFLNPFSTDQGQWDFGITFRQEEPDDEYRLVVRSDGYWSLNNRTPGVDDFIIEGDVLEYLDLDDDGANLVELIVVGEVGYFFLNGEFIELLDLEGRVEEGNIALGTGYYTISEQPGSRTEYEQLTIWPFTAVFGPQDGALEHEINDLIKLESAGVDLTNALISATFDNPFSTDESEWDIGLAFRDDDGTKYWLIVASEQYWELVARFGNADTDTTITEGELGNLNLAAGETNEITIIAWGEYGYLFINGEFVETLDLFDIVHDGDVQVVTAFYFDHELEGESTDYEEFTIWELP
jgi:serine/threonine-protein kinase